MKTKKKSLNSKNENQSVQKTHCQNLGVTSGILTSARLGKVFSSSLWLVTFLSFASRDRLKYIAPPRGCEVTSLWYVTTLGAFLCLGKTASVLSCSLRNKPQKTWLSKGLLPVKCYLPKKRWWVGADTLTHGLGHGRPSKDVSLKTSTFTVNMEDEVGKYNHWLSNISSCYSDLLLR